MDRRAFLGKSVLAASTILFNPLRALGKSKSTKNVYGWVPSAQRTPNLYSFNENIKYLGSEKVVCFWKTWKKVTGNDWIPRFQASTDCVGMATGSALDILGTLNIGLKGKREKFITLSSTDMIHAGGRIEMGKSRLTTAGMYGWCGVQYLKKYGNLLRLPYPPYDLTPYSEDTVRYWDKNGIPEALLIEAKKHPLLNYAQVKSWEELRDGVAAGNPAIFCSMMGADNDQRDEDGFIKPSGKWAHAWTVGGIRDDKRPGACLFNSHGSNFGRGPKTFDQPDGTVWIDAKYIDKYLKDDDVGEGFILTDYQGFIAPEVDYVLW